MLDGIKIPESKMLGFAFFGVVLYLGSTYLNIQQHESANLGVGLGIFLITISIDFQIISWKIKYISKPKP
ncbi:MAG: hypothetical protein HQ505_05230 [Nitrosopumilus sp.]|nr:hypothetical protein [Nitrosopumilus sp.]